MHFWRRRYMLYFVLTRRIPEMKEMRVERLASGLRLSKWLESEIEAWKLSKSIDKMMTYKGW